MMLKLGTVQLLLLLLRTYKRVLVFLAKLKRPCYSLRTAFHDSHGLK